MKRKTINIIITIIISVVIMCTLSLTAFAEESTYQYYAFSSVDSSFNSKKVYSGLRTSDVTQSYISATLCSGEGFDQYISTDFVNSNGFTGYLENKLVSNDFNSSVDKRNINYIGLDCAVFCDANTNLNNLPFEPFAMIVNGYEVRGAFTASIVSTKETTQAYPNGGGPEQFTYTYRRLKVRIRFNDDFRFRKDDDVVFVLRSQVFPIYDPYYTRYRDIQYSIGVNNLEVGYMTQEDFIENTAHDVKDISDSVKVISSSIDKTNQILNTIHYELNKALPEDTQIKIENNYIIMEERYKEEESVEAEFDKVTEIIDDNGYEIINNDNQGDIDSAKQSYNESGLGGFFQSIWNLDWIKSAILITLGFIGIKVGIYGV